MHSNASLTVGRLPGQLVPLFFRNFFRVLLCAVSVSEWIVLAHVSRTIRSLPPLAHLAAPLGIFLFNRYLAQRARQQGCNHNPLGSMPRLYYAAAFTCLFCALVLVGTDLLFLQEMSKLKDIPMMLEHLEKEEDYKSAAEYVRQDGAKTGIKIFNGAKLILHY